MKYFIDTEFLEGTQRKLFGRTKPTIDLISIGIVAEDGREYYGISKEFNLREAWNRADEEDRGIDGYRKTFWLRNNVLKSVFDDLAALYTADCEKMIESRIEFNHRNMEFTYRNMKWLLQNYGLSREELAHGVFTFVHAHTIKKWDDKFSFAEEIVKHAYQNGEKPLEFYGWYCDYDWVVFCWIWGSMRELPIGFPMYCRDLKQEYDRLQERIDFQRKNAIPGNYQSFPEIKLIPNWPKQENEHNALEDARWTKKAFTFLNGMWV